MSGHLSHRKYGLINDAVHQAIQDTNKADELAAKIHEILGYDPNRKFYNPEKGAKARMRNKLLAEEKGVTIYELCGQKTYYHRKQKTPYTNGNNG